MQINVKKEGCRPSQPASFCKFLFLVDVILEDLSEVFSQSCLETGLDVVHTGAFYAVLHGDILRWLVVKIALEPDLAVTIPVSAAVIARLHFIGAIDNEVLKLKEIVWILVVNSELLLDGSTECHCCWVGVVT